MKNKIYKNKIYTATDHLAILFSPLLETAFGEIEMWLARRQAIRISRRLISVA